jgi:hypothetical protein
MTNLIVNVCGWSDCSAGVRVMNYLPAMLHAAGYPVFVDEPCHYNPLLPVRRDPGPEDIMIYPDGTRGNPYHAKRVCRYMLYFATGWFKGDRIAKDECCIVYHRVFFDDVAAHCDHPVGEDDIITLPIIAPEWCFPEPKTIENAYWEGKPLTANKKEPDVPFERITVPDHNRTLAILRRTKNFYTPDPYSGMANEASLCGCHVYMLDEQGNYARQRAAIEWAKAQVMNPERDVRIARQFAERVYQFFGVQP